jgi:hypothetical protein
VRDRRLRLICIAVLALSLAIRGRAQLNDYQKVDFYFLQNYDYNAEEKWEPTPKWIAGPPIPAFVKALEGKRIAVAGTTMPLTYRSGVVSEFILGLSADTCEFGATPRINEWISVTMAHGTKAQVYAMGESTVRGVFHVKEMVEGGKVVQLYSMEADSVK